MIRSALALTLLVLTGAAPATPPRRGVLPALPTVVYGRNGDVPIKLVKTVDCPQPPENETPANVIGCYTFRTRTIQIADTLTLAWKFFVLFHEQVHVAARDEGLFYPGPPEEMYASVVGRYRLGELLRAYAADTVP